MSEKRGAHRIRVRVRAEYVSATTQVEAWVENLSRCGIFLRAPVLDPTGTEAELAIHLDDRAPLIIGAEVVRHDNSALGPGMGLRFAPLAATAMRRLANYMIEQSYQASA